MAERHNDCHIVKDNLKNPHQLRDAVDSVYYRIVCVGFNRSLSSFFNMLRCVPFGYRYRNIDGRWKEAKAVEAAQAKAYDALWELDEALKALDKRLGIKEGE